MSSFQAVIIEPDKAHFGVLSAALNDLTPDADILHFANVGEFFETYKKSISAPVVVAEDEQDGNEEEEQNFDFSLMQLIVADIGITHKVDQALWKKFLKFLNKHHQEGESNARFIYTGFDSGKEFDPRNYHSDVVFNILIKPFDPVIVRQTLALALADDGPLRIEDLYQHDQPATIELIKDIEIDRLTELGFRTKSKRAIEINKVARYFGSPFEEGGSNSVFAYCYANQEMASDPPQFSSSFSFLGIPKAQLGAIRRAIQADPNTMEYPFPGPTEDGERQTPSMILFAQDESFGKHLVSVVDDKFSGLDFRWMNSAAELLEYLPIEQRQTIDGATAPRVLSTDQAVLIKFDGNFKQILDVQWAEGEDPKPPEVLVDLSSTGIFDSFKDQPKLASPKMLKGKLGGFNVLLNALKLEHQIELDVGKVWLLTVQEPTVRECHEELSQSQNPCGPIQAVFFHFDSLSERTLSLISKAVSILNGESGPTVKIFLFSEKAMSTYQELDSIEGLDDVFLLPLDIYYLSRKIKMHCPQVVFKDVANNSRHGIEIKEGIKTALPLTVDSVSEVHISFKYPRAIRIADVRRLILWVPNTKEMPEILAICRHCEKVSENSYQCDFMFFAVQDKQLKHIRQWIKQNYAQAKQNEDGAG